ncbi:polyribonucleotide nucleotidyltransferase [candidate division Kazan bacterium RIFCSPHIGHO2_01_FULL_49_10]|uniref:Polyribonucleotide nucleotidyltransferase n=1 Tax=candidate division Kazan bacterium RIFCSPLOWO2_01_FULL_48_13 TaxID=1798539 RepID=A0A1F4PNC8_UNCK3|nr:MAG: polyribonucleotide nucleotidyltransferase [candidate division Kazan bacterium RIFCSPHIGHO2_01_FULL_49_10]OGB85197.1 MAG: polyribonucleotide nucleotidyltransferase [candidate division Kazan bacterium RIFCSPLOWO2_01_FULL_48_13]
MEKFESKLGSSKLTMETGKLARLASGSVTVRLGDTVVLATASIAEKPREGIDFFPLLVDFEEKMYASGKISGSRFIKREGRASENAILTSRLTDRPLRPLFPKGFYNDVQIVITVLSADLVHDPDVLSIIAASAALMLSDAPFDGPVGAIRVGLIHGELVANPSYEQLENESQLDLVVAGTRDRVMMIEAGANEVDEATMLRAIKFAHEAMQPSIDLQHQLIAGKQISDKKNYPLHLPEEQLITKVAEFVGTKATEAIYHPEKTGRNTRLAELREQVWQTFVSEETPEATVAEVFSKIVSKEFRKNLLEKDQRPDGRKLDEVRPITCEVGILPRPHGSALFTRGETQALTIVTLGSAGDEQMIDTMELDTTKRYMHHYNFPPYATGEIKPMRGPGRREIGHGALAERALLPMIPPKDSFPYTVRVVSEILSSNGSSSMASVCGSTLSLMDAGVPIKKPVSGVAMGVVTDDSGNFKILTDIAGIEDFNGDMDFKVAGTKDGITAMQLDMKVRGLGFEVFEQAFAQAYKGRMHILEIMQQCLTAPRPELSMYAPRVTVIKIHPDKIREVIGPGGKMINDMISRAGGKSITEINIEDDGTVYVSSTNAKYATQVVDEIKNMTREVQAGEKFVGKVTRIMDFGAFVEIFPGTEGLVHISQLANQRVEKVTDIVKVGDTLPVVVVEIDSMGRLNLSHKATLPKDAR